MATARRAAKKLSAAKTIKRVMGRPVLLPVGEEDVDESKETGRPTSYRPQFDDRAKTMSLAGFTQAKMAELFGISVPTFMSWCDKHVSFLECVKWGEEQADAEVERSLHQTATGYVLEEEELKIVARGNNEGSEVERHKVEKWYPPSPTSQIFYLSNRKRDRYRRGDAGFDSGQTPETLARSAQAAVRAALATITTDDEGDDK